jgi:O-antigen/teichoic acid export membrane protein
MRERHRGIAANSALALLGDAVAKASGLLAIAIAARGLSTGQFAMLGAALAAITIVSAAFDGGLSVLIVRDGAAERPARWGILRAGLAARVPLVVPAVAVAAAVGIALDELPLALLVVAASALGALTVALLALFRAAQDLSLEAGQKLLVGILVPAGVAAAVALRADAVGVLIAYVCAQALGLVILLLHARRLRGEVARKRVLDTLRACAPFALMALATLVYYRSGTLMLAAWGSDADTAAFTIASTIALGLLAVPNAITTGLLPGLSASASQAVRLQRARRALGWTLALCAGLALAVGAAAPWALPLVFGDRYDGAVTPLAVLLASDLLIGVSGVLATLLIASGRNRPLVLQVSASLAVNLVAAALLIPLLGALGAALATLATETVALAILLISLRGQLARLVLPRETESLPDDRVLGALRA